MNRQSLIVLVVIVIIVIIAAWFVWQKYSSSSPASLSQNSTPTPTRNANITNVQGVQVEVLKEGNGAAAQNGDGVTVNYVGTLQNGTKFDSSIDRGQPFSFTLGSGQVIRGWDIGVLGMKIGEERKLTIPPNLAYGANGAGNVIPPNATLIFDVTMLDINSQGK